MPGSRHATKLKAIAARTYRLPRKYYCTVYISITYRFNVEEDKLTNTTNSRIALYQAIIALIIQSLYEFGDISITQLTK